MSEYALRLRGVSKMYKVFPSRTANLADALGLPGPRRFREFWALRGIDLELPHGKRLGIVGRNGAGKSTLLKLITGNIVPTVGTVDVAGSVQALLDAGAGFHPEFTGEENIRAALTLQAVPSSRMNEAIEEIAEFTELGEFLAQPFRTYSAGMQARLAFATATAVQPEILIVDEMLSAGDAYFSSKANERMRGLVDSGASLLLVSHSLDHVTMFCEEAIWLDRGRIVRQGSSLEVVKAYQQFSRVLEERRLKAKNAKQRQGKTRSFELDNYADSIVAKLTVAGESAWAEVGEVSLKRDDQLEDSVLVGDAQDAGGDHAAYVVIGEGAGWSDPTEAGDRMARRLEVGDGVSSGSVIFNLFSFYGQSSYSLETVARGRGSLTLEFIRDGRSIDSARLELSEDVWTTGRLEVTPRVQAVGAPVTEADYDLALTPRAPRRAAAAGGESARRALDPDPVRRPRADPTHWPGEGSITVGDVTLLGTGGEQAVFEVGSPLSLVMSFVAQRSGQYRVIPVAVLYRRDGILVSTHVGEAFETVLEVGDESAVRLDLKRLNLGNGYYVFSVALYRHLAYLEEPEIYDLVDRSYEFEVVGNDPSDGSLFHHPAEWHLP